MEIRLAQQTDLEPFFQYLDIHLQGNGAGNDVVFQPVPREESRVTETIRNKFSVGVTKTIGEDGWRVLILATLDYEDLIAREIIGHIDIRPYPNKYSHHRALLGMGVASQHRRKGIGERLLKSMLEWMRNNTVIEYLDLWVMSDNIPAIKLYKKLGFVTCANINDMYRFDEKSISESMMSLKVRGLQ